MNLQPPATLLFGPAGSGKTASIATFAKAGIETFVLGTEPGFAESLIDHATRINAPLSKIHWATALPKTSGFSAMSAMTEKISALSFEDVAKIKVGIGKDQTRAAAMGVLTLLQDFKCERDGKSYGDVTSWGPDRCFVLDSLSGLSLISWYLTVGHKPTAHEGEWSIAMNWIHDLLLKLTSDRSCYLVVTAHDEKETDPISGANKVYVSTLGRKLAPKIPKFFSDVVKTYKSGTSDKDVKYLWRTIDTASDLKNRSLPIGEALEPNFKAVTDSYQKRLKDVAAALQSASSPTRAA